MSDRIRERRGSDGPDGSRFGFSSLDGSSQDRAGAVDIFQNDRRTRVFLISSTAGGEGLKRTAADHVYLLDPWWNPFVDEQAVARVHGIGQSRRAQVFRFVARGTFEERVWDLQARKREIADFLVGDEAGRKGPSAEEILEVLEA